MKWFRRMKPWLCVAQNFAQSNSHAASWENDSLLNEMVPTVEERWQAYPELKESLARVTATILPKNGLFKYVSCRSKRFEERFGE